MSKKHLCGIGVSVFILVAMFFVPGSGLLTAAGIRTIGLLLAFLILLITEAMPMMLTCLVCLGLMPLLGITKTFGAALSGFSHQVVFFILASFGIAAAFTETPLSRRALIVILKKFGKNIKGMLLAVMACTAVISSMVSNVPTCAVFMSIIISFLELYNRNPLEQGGSTDMPNDDKRRTGRAFMIAIPVASMIGGMMTPAGSSINLLAIGLLEEYTGKTISFVHWMAAGIPLAIIVLPIAWLLMYYIFKPAEMSREQVTKFLDSLDVPEKITKEEVKALIIVAIMFVLWVLSSWFRSINVMVVALLGACAFCLPGIMVLEFKTFRKNISWESFFLVGTVLSLGAAMINNKVSDCIVQLIPHMQLSAPLLVAFVTALTFVLLVIIPVAPSLVAVIALPFITLAIATGNSPVLIMLTLGLCVANCYLLPLDTVPMLTYSTGYNSMTDMMKSTLPLQIAIVIIMSIWMPVIGRILQL